MDFEFKENYTVNDLVEIMQLLRSENGCPWDREQDHKSIRKNFIEEVYEVCEAIDLEDTELLKEELGDVLLQVVFHSRMEEEQGRFSFNDVADGISKKLIVRHPHIFTNRVKADTAEEVLANWEDIKNSQKGIKRQSESLNKVPRVLPALMRAQKLQSRAAKSGFDYPSTQYAAADLLSEVAEVAEAMALGNGQGVCEELGDLLFSCVNLARLMNIDAEEALTKASDKFSRRFEKVEELALAEEVDMTNADIAKLNDLWARAKKLI